MEMPAHHWPSGDPVRPDHTRRVYEVKTHPIWERLSQNVLDVRISAPTPTSNISHHHLQVVFWLREFKNPAFDARELLKAGDIEANPGPRQSAITPAEQKCDGCNTTLTRPGFECSIANCKAVSHKQQKCSRLRNSSSAPWKCVLHRVATEADGPCEWCNKHFTARQKPLLCSVAGCATRCHTVMRCSGISRYLKNPAWICEKHGGRTKPPPTSEATTLKLPCTRCKKIMRSGIYIKCGSCEKRFHKSCTKTSREVQDKISAGIDSWTCNKCEKIRLAICSQDDAIPVLHDLVGDRASKMKLFTKKSLRILQWNADSLATKIGELRERVKDRDVDVILIQETKLRGKPTPRIDGYKEAMRSDRIVAEGGGLLCYIEETLIFEKLFSVSKFATESTTFRVRLDKKTWVHITNVYIPPANSVGQEIKFSPEAIPVLQSSVICGDFNGHTSLWDEHQPQDSRGDQVLNWIIDNELDILNVGDRTRESRITGNPSAPDVSLCGRRWYGKCTWNTEEDIGGSDHLPILITLNNSVTHQSVTGRTPRWKSKGIDWSKFTDEIEGVISEINTDESLSTVWPKFGDVLVAAGHKHVGKVKPGKKTKPWLTPKVRAAVKDRNALRRKIKWKRREWLQACAKVREETRNAQMQS